MSNSITLRFSRQAFAIVVLAALCVAVAPRSMRAQESAPVAQSAPAASTAAAPVSKEQSEADAKKSEEEETLAFRHTPLIQSIARALHLQVETTARLFEFINFAIIVFAIVIPLVRIMPKVLRKRSQTLQHDLESARKVTEDAKSRLAAVETRLSKLDEEIAEIRAHVEEDGKNDEARIKATIDEESTRILAAAEQEIASAATHARLGLRTFAADLAIEQAARQLALTPETDRALIAEFVSDAVKGGQN